jgi:DNA-binding transcriptional LysR family regulator
VLSVQRYRLVASPEYLAIRGAPQTPDDLRKHSCLLYKGQQGAQRWYFRWTSEENFESVDVSGPLRSNNAEVLVAAAMAGRGIVLLPSWMFNQESFTANKLSSVLTDWDKSASPDDRQIQILSPENRLRSQKVREVSTFLVDAIESPPYWDR